MNFSIRFQCRRIHKYIYVYSMPDLPELPVLKSTYYQSRIHSICKFEQQNENENVKRKKKRNESEQNGTIYILCPLGIIRMAPELNSPIQLSIVSYGSKRWPAALGQQIRFFCFCCCCCRKWLLALTGALALSVLPVLLGLP